MYAIKSILFSEDVLQLSLGNTTGRDNLFHIQKTFMDSLLYVWVTVFLLTGYEFTTGELG